MIKVMIERQIAADKLGEYQEIIRGAKQKASRSQGYLAGEVLHQSGQQNHTLILSIWENMEAWQNWADSETRLQMLDRLKPLLESEEKVMILENQLSAH